MKKLIVIFIVLHQYLIFGQNSPCVNNVSTDPNAPTNSNLPNDNDPNFNYDQLFLNGFNWIPFNQSGSLGDLETTGLSHLGGDQYMFPLYNPSLGKSSYYQYIRDELIMPTGGVGGVIPNHQQGWELLAVNLGFYPDGTAYTDIPGETNKHPRIPYVILYHRYLSKIRVFANIGDTWAEENAYQAVRIRLSLNTSNQNVFNGLFRLQEGLDRTLDQPTNVRSIGALAEAPNDKQNWFSADFTVAFDPCVCDHPSAFNIDFELVKNIDLKLYGRGIEVEDIVEEDGTFSHKDYFSGFSVDFDNPEIVDGGFIMYKKMGDLFDDYIDKMEAYEIALDNANQHNERVERNLAIVKWVKYAVEFGVTAATGGGSVAVSLTNELLSHASGIVGSNITTTELSSRWEKVFEEAEKILGTEIMTFVNDNFKTQEPPSVPVKPTANFSEMYFEGRLQQVDPKNGPTIYTPGTYGNSITEDLIDQHHYPVYNEPLGVFALLEKPQVDVTYQYDSEYSFYQVGSPMVISYPEMVGLSSFTSEDLTNVKRVHISQVKLKDKLSFLFNPVLPIKDYEIEASLIVKAKNENVDPRPHYIVENDTIFLTETNDMDYYPPMVKSSEHDINTESISFNVGEETVMGDESFEFQTTYVPIDAFANLVGSIATYDERIYPTPVEDYPNSPWPEAEHNEDRNLIRIDTVYLKLLVNVTFDEQKTDGSPHEYTYIYTYEMVGDDINEVWGTQLYPNLPGSPGDITQYPENLFLAGADFDGSEVEGCQLNAYNNKYTCKAWNDIIVDGDFTVDSEYEVKVEAGNEINITPESNPATEMQFSIVPVLDFSNPMPPVDGDYVTKFCDDENRYQAHKSSLGTKNLALDSTDSKSFIPINEASEFAFNIYPNPTNGSTTASISLSDAGKGELFITDINGRRLESAFDNKLIGAGQSEYQLPTQTLSKGIYLVHLFVNGEHHVKRLVKN